MKYRIINDGEEGEFIVLTEDGGCVAIHHNGDNIVSTYYQKRLTDIENPNEVWNELAEGKIYLKDWDIEPTREIIIKDALDWLVCPAPKKFIEDNSIFNNPDFAWENNK
jgi:hypothetical protein